VTGVRLSDFWERMDGVLGPAYAQSWAKDTVLAELGSRSVVQALADGEPTVDVWRAVVVHLRLPATHR